MNRHTKIIATLGPSSSSKEDIAALMDAGADLFRLNFSHGAHDDVAAMIKHIRALEKEYDRFVGILADLQGPKLRIGTFEGDKVSLEKDTEFTFDSNDKLGNKTRVYLPHPDVIKALDVGDHILLDDGRAKMEVLKKTSKALRCRIVYGEELSNKKGFNIPGVILPLPALTDKDKVDLEFALKQGVDWIAQSFVQTPEDAAEAKKLIDGRAALMVKLEKPSALARLEEILDYADGVMLARGDLGVEMPPEEVPSIQKRVVRMVREAGKPVVVATQMLESMISSARPTRAEASDVATAIYDGTDAVMLSGETASGEYPKKSVEMMARICESTENDATYIQVMELYHPDTDFEPSDAITTAAYYVAQDIGATCIVNYTTSGSTALRTARQRPFVPILCLTPNKDVARRLVLSYGVKTVYVPEIIEDFTGPARHAAEIAKRVGFASQGDKFVMTAGVPFGTPGSTNILRIGWVE